MKRSLRAVTAIGAVAAAMALMTPAASADPGDAQDCTTVLIQSLLTTTPEPELVEVTYTPPATVNVSADGAIAQAQPFVTWVDCVV
ncbi:MAG TPA: hypothetical protein VEV43_12375 [Actinomycetota bacterium]|nr:hypothetical protein [Actinomycetota bacterium]